MNPHQPPYPHRLRPVLAALGFLAAALLLQAQPSTGTIQGRVYNPAAQQYVRNAEVRLLGTNQVDYTENDGSFSFPNVPVGTATVVVSYSGYDEVRQPVTVTAGTSRVEEINLTSSGATGTTGNGVVKLEAFTVSSEREGNSKAIMEQRRNMNIVTSVSADVFGDVTDGNVGEFLKYLPGVDLDYVESEPRGPRLGGMDGQYVGVSMDGMRTASADANRGDGEASRATSFEGFSITSVESIEINRTASPENDADSPAGTVNMKTKRAFDVKGRRLDYNVGVNFNSDDFRLSKIVHPGEKAQYQWKPNWQFTYRQSFADQKFGILLGANRGWSITQQTKVTNDYNLNSGLQADKVTTDPRPMVIRQIDFGDGPKWIQKDALLLTADWKVTPRLTLSLNLNYSYFSGQFWNRNLTFVAANSNTNIKNGRSTVQGDAMTTVIARRAPDGTNNDVAGLRWGGGGADKKVWTRQYSPKFEYKFGPLVVDGALAFSRSVNRYDAFNEGFASSAEGNMEVPSSWTATRPNDQSWEWTIHETEGADWFDMGSFVGTSNTQQVGTSITNRTETWATEKWTGTLNARYMLPFFQRFPTVVKVGGKWDEESRRNHNWNNWAKWSYNGPGGNTVTYDPKTETYKVATKSNWINVGPEYESPLKFDRHTSNMFTIYNTDGVEGVPPRPSRSEPVALFKAHPEYFVNTANVNDYYNAFIANDKNFRQTVTAGYAQADTIITPKMRVRFGVRWEQTENRFVEYQPLTPLEMLDSPYASQFTPRDSAGNTVPRGSPDIDRVSPDRATSVSGLFYQYTTKPKAVRRSRYDNWFPSIILKYNIRPNLEWQVGVNKAISRPPIGNLTGLWAVNDNADPPVVTAPNPELQPEYHKVYQTRLAYYFGNRSPGQLSAAFIQDDAENFRETFTFDNGDVLGVTDPIYDGYEFKTTRNSLEEQRYRNMDLTYQQTLGFLPSEYLKGISINTTYSRSYASQRRKGLSPHRFTARLGYAYRRFNGAIGAVWLDDRPDDYRTSNYGRYRGALTKFDANATFRINSRLSLYVQARNITNVKDLTYQSPPGVTEGEQGKLRYMEQYGANWVFGVKGSF